VQCMMVHATFHTFLQMRAVCRTWCNLARTVTPQWMWWLERHGERSGRAPLLDHSLGERLTGCQLGAACTNKHHYWTRGRPPLRLLKTMPLCDQVLRQAAQSARRHMISTLQYWANEAPRAIATAERARARLRTAQIESAVTERVFERLETRLKQRKRRRIVLPDSNQ